MPRLEAKGPAQLSASEIIGAKVQPWSKSQTTGVSRQSLKHCRGASERQSGTSGQHNITKNIISKAVNLGCGYLISE